MSRNLLTRASTRKESTCYSTPTTARGDLQIKFVHNFNDKTKAEGPFEVSWLNSYKDDAYPTFSSDFSTVYFCSNRDGNFDIFEVAVPTDKKQLLQTLLSDKLLPVTKNTRLSSPADDKCPHLPGSYLPGKWSNDNVMYFVSDRSGGYGGFDIYYSTRENSQWKQPVNMGNRINTTYDEYRPVTLRDRSNFDYHVGIFSSNRPGGKGGFDLYAVGFLKVEEIPYGQ
ncbi:TolB-like translocation protein [Telluribacter humicola]|uniref:PD40 domain-containing protein n=1 Tax=Telluribacter humicola TaxID=1720261 RepID=UPI001A95AC16|nr:PD40 domain-containing protein [Telluribacter humicola]